MVQGHSIETVFENGEDVVPPGLPRLSYDPTESAEADRRKSEEVIAGTAHWARLDAKFRKQQETGQLEIEEVEVRRVACTALEPTVSTELL